MSPVTINYYNEKFNILELQSKRLQLDGGDRGDRSDRKRKSRFGDDDDTIPEKTLVPMVCAFLPIVN